MVAKPLGVFGAFLALFGCVLGNYFSLIAFAAAEVHVGLITMLSSVDSVQGGHVHLAEFHPTDILFYAIAVYEGYRFSAVRPPTFKSFPQTG